MGRFGVNVKDREKECVVDADFGGAVSEETVGNFWLDVFCYVYIP